MSERNNKSCEVGSRKYCKKVLNYVKAFKRLDETGKHTWNWAAFFFGELWMAYRKMYLYTFFVSVIDLIFSLCVSFYVYGNFSSFYLLRNDHPNLFFSIILCYWLISGVFTGYFGNALYYRTIKKKIKKGYHLLDKYSPTSIPSIIGWLFICLADWMSRKFQLKTEVKSEVNEETIRAYLNPNKKDHIVNKIANVLAWFVFFIV